jgi:single-stranded DNA-binding protein
MMAALVQGAIFRAIELKCSKTGRPFAAAKLKVKDGDVFTWVKVLAFADHAIAELERLGNGDNIAVQGALKCETYQKDGETKIGFTIFADQVMPLRAEKKPRADREAPSSEPRPAARRQNSQRPLDRHAGDGRDEFGDEIPF